MTPSSMRRRCSLGEKEGRENGLDQVIELASSLNFDLSERNWRYFKDLHSIICGIAADFQGDCLRVSLQGSNKENSPSNSCENVISVL